MLNKDKRTISVNIKNLNEAVKVFLEISPIIIAVIGAMVTLGSIQNTSYKIVLGTVIILMLLIILALSLFSLQYSIKSNLMRVKILFTVLFLLQLALLLGILTISKSTLFAYLYFFLLFLFSITSYFMQRNLINLSDPGLYIYGYTMSLFFSTISMSIFIISSSSVYSLIPLILFFVIFGTFYSLTGRRIKQKFYSLPF